MTSRTGVRELKKSHITSTSHDGGYRQYTKKYTLYAGPSTKYLGGLMPSDAFVRQENNDLSSDQCQAIIWPILN